MTTRPRRPATKSDAPVGTTSVRKFSDNALAQMLFGPHNSHLERIERQLGVVLNGRGNSVAISGGAESTADAIRVLDDLYALLQQQGHLETADVDGILRMTQAGAATDDGLSLQTRKRRIAPRTPVQAQYLDAMNKHELVFGLGPAGTGKTYLAVAKGVTLMMEGVVDRIILSRPAVEAGERLGFLPGDLKDKIDPYLRPLYDALHDMLPGDQVAKKIAAGDIEVAPLAFMRGRTLANSFVILDEAQNTTTMQMMMFLTRMGENSRMVVTGDLTQIDLPSGTKSGLLDAVETLEGIGDIGFVRFSHLDVVRHSLVAKIIKAYEKRKGLKP